MTMRLPMCHTHAASLSPNSIAAVERVTSPCRREPFILYKAWQVTPGLFKPELLDANCQSTRSVHMSYLAALVGIAQ